jgi:hypothetical protein
MQNHTGFRPGDRVALVHTGDPYTRLQPGDEGTVVLVRYDGDDWVISIRWDSGSRMSVLPSAGDIIELVRKTS